jgi:hypothetical protein
MDRDILKKLSIPQEGIDCALYVDDPPTIIVWYKDGTIKIQSDPTYALPLLWQSVALINSFQQAFYG